jgi:exodeoxyribonuclease V alpha subunit
MIKGVGEKYAARIVEAFGLDTLRVLDEEPEKLRKVEGLGKKRIDAIVSGWRAQRQVREVMVFLQAHGASPALATRILKRYGAEAMAVVSREPYRLALDVWGVGFKTADRIAQAAGIAKDSPERMQAGVLQTIHDITDQGHVYVGDEELTARAAAMLELPAEAQATRDAIDAAVRDLTLAGHVVTETVHGARLVFAREMHEAEERLAKRLGELAAHAGGPPLPGAAGAIDEFEARAGVALAPEQRRAIEQAARSEVLVVTGGPGVGKTTIVRAILAVFDREGLLVRLAAPTGRAAKRMSEATGREASTLHRLLEFDPKRATFKRGKDTPLDAGAVVVDEASMLDLPMADALLSAVAPGTRLVLVGDVDQLPSVGPGAVLRDIIASRKVPCVRLTQIFRQAAQSLIVTNAHRINSGEEPVAPPPGDTRADFFIVEKSDPDAAQATILELVTSRIPKRFGFDPARDVQVLTPMHRGPAGSLALNAALQEALNPLARTGAELTRGGRAFRVGDKVMQLKNDYEKLVFNGDVGFVTGIEKDEEEEQTLLRVRYDDREVRYAEGSLDELSLSYACSVHKSQGSEYPAVVVPLLTTHYVMLSRNLLYTAVTRGKRLVVLVCDRRALRMALGESRKDERRTRLAGKIGETGSV